MKRRRKSNPSGLDVVGFIVGLALPIGVSAVAGAEGVVAAGSSVVLGTAAGIAGASTPGFFRGAAVGSAGALVVQLVRGELARRAALEAVRAIAAAQASPRPSNTANLAEF